MKNIISTDQAPAAIGPYSQAVATGNLLFTSGQIALSPEGNLVEGSIREQTRQVLSNLRAVLEAGGSSLTLVLKCTCFLKNLNDFAAMNEIYAEFFETDPPARSTIQVARLPKDVLIEIEAIALIPEVPLEAHEARV